MSSGDDDYGNPQREIEHRRTLARMKLEESEMTREEEIAMLDRLREMYEKATKGLWKKPRLSANVVEMPRGGTITVQHVTHPDDVWDRDVREALEADANLIAALHNNFPALEAIARRAIRAEKALEEIKMKCTGPHTEAGDIASAALTPPPETPAT